MYTYTVDIMYVLLYTPHIRLVIEMQTIHATQARKEWSATLDIVARDKPIIIKRTRDLMFLSDITLLSELLEVYKYHARIITEDNGSVTISLDEIDLIENAPAETEAVQKMASSILDYAEDYYADFAYWARGDRKAHIPYIFKALILNDINKIGGLIECRHGGN